MSGNNSVVECNLAKVEVASSNLVSRSIGIGHKLAALAGIIVIVLRPRNSVVEYLLGKEEVIGSIPIVGSNHTAFQILQLLLHEYRSTLGAVMQTPFIASQWI
jgi:hypothetical protein